MKKISYTVLGIVIVWNTYATIRAVYSYSKFNNAVKSINCCDLRQDMQCLNEVIKLREVQDNYH